MDSTNFGQYRVSYDGNVSLYDIKYTPIPDEYAKQMLQTADVDMDIDTRDLILDNLVLRAIRQQEIPKHLKEYIRRFGLKEVHEDWIRKARSTPYKDELNRLINLNKNEIQYDSN